MEDIETALLEEVVLYDILDESVDEQIGGEEPWQGIAIVNDSRHGWRKNSKDISVLAIGDRSHKVLKHEHITRADDRVAQRHEKLGTQRIYNYLNKKDTPVRIHVMMELCQSTSLYVRSHFSDQ